MSTPRREYLDGVRAVAPALLGTIPFGLMTGVATVGAGVPADIGVLMSAVVFAGTAQLAAMQLLRDGTPLLVILATVVVINLRFVMYSATIAPHFRHLSLRWRVVLGYVLSDNGFAASIVRFSGQPDNPDRHWFYFGSCSILWIGWALACAAGIYAGAQIPRDWALDFVIPLIFIGIVAPAIRDRAMVAAAVMAGAIALIARGLPFQLGMITAAVAGIATGMIVEAWRR